MDHTASYRDIPSERYFRFNYDNDYFDATDRNYTQGYSFELVLPVLEKNPINRLLIAPKENSKRYGVAVEHIGYTPHYYERPEIQDGDRPFAAAIMLKSFVITTNSSKKSRLSSSLSLGLIGPGAFGKEMQVGIHKATGNDIPLGWKHQIKNDVVVNYNVHYEKQVLRYENIWSVQADASANLGTLFTNASIGVNSSFGILNQPFSANTERKFKLYAYIHPAVSVIGYDATLQGGVLNKESPYIIDSSAVERLTAQFNYGLVLQTRTLYFEYARSLITREFETGTPAGWGGIKIGFTF
ncbi:lipid A deacylase LpxR family protein [Gelidibacter algens]|uniref:lipid A deacylase LpxR family protein n=1 Tax=Gelidibacter algens TaxID=49280 RepID=UPI001FE27932|nr:lipid A deacylase LpxR family protein [Gelidibacter algens]